MRHLADLWAVLFVLTCFSFQLGLYLFASWQVAAIAMFLFLPVFQLVRSCLHNYYHQAVFRSAAANRVYEVILFLCTGLSPHQFTLHHVLGHHLLYLEPKKDPLGWTRQDGTEMNIFEYLARGTIRLYSFPFAIGAQYPKVFRRFKIGLVYSLLLLGLLVALSPVQALVCYLVPMAVLMVDIIRQNWWQHVGCSTEHHLVASRNDLRRFYNWVTFNIGYHTAHHVSPGSHWTHLPDLHAELANSISPELQQGSTDLPKKLSFGTWRLPKTSPQD